MSLEVEGESVCAARFAAGTTMLSSLPSLLMMILKRKWQISQ